MSRQATKPLHTQRGDSICRLPIGSLGHLSKCEHDCLSCTHCMGAKLRDKSEIQAFPILNKVKMTFFVSFLHQNATFSLSFITFYYLFVRRIPVWQHIDISTIDKENSYQYDVGWQPFFSFRICLELLTDPVTQLRSAAEVQGRY